VSIPFTNYCALSTRLFAPESNLRAAWPALRAPPTKKANRGTPKSNPDVVEYNQSKNRLVKYEDKKCSETQGLATRSTACLSTDFVVTKRSTNGGGTQANNC
jgi:hypothetical protein